MALFKILRGLQENLNEKAIIDGQILVCTDTGNIYVDFAEEGKAAERVQLNKEKLNAANPEATGTFKLDSVPIIINPANGNLRVSGKDIATWEYVNSKINGLATEKYVRDAVDDMATQSYVNNQISTATSNMATTSDVESATAGMATQEYVGNQISTATANMATTSYVTTEIAKIPTIYSDIGEPADKIGKVGDIYIQLAKEG